MALAVSRGRSLRGCLPVVWVCVFLLQACTNTSLGSAASSKIAATEHCARVLEGFESEARATGLELSEPRAVPAFPAVASNRFLASFEPEQLSEQQREDWLERLLEAGARRRTALALMFASQPVTERIEVRATLAQLDACARKEVANFDRSPERWQDLAEALSVDDDYLLSRRVLGLYPLTSLGVGAGIKQLQLETQRIFALPEDALPRQGELLRFIPESVAVDEVSPPSGGQDSLGVRLPEEGQLQALLTRHAPIWEIDVVGPFDRPGEPYFETSGKPRVNSSEPLVYQYASLTRFSGEVRLQLNYLMWFDGRPAGGAFDSLAGALDGLLWRVTLDTSGDVLAYDSVHACGCYQTFFPTPRLRPRPAARELAEPPLIAQLLLQPRGGARPILRVSSGAHYLQGVSWFDAADTASLSASHVNSGKIENSQKIQGAAPQVYRMRPYASLYAVADPDGTRSLFGRRGLVPGTQRGERFYLWPMGVRSPGAMRERGRQATAFLGRRHFDDAFLLDAMFELQDQ